MRKGNAGGSKPQAVSMNDDFEESDGGSSVGKWFLARYQEPEIRRTSLEQLCLQIMKLNFGNPVKRRRGQCDAVA